MSHFYCKLSKSGRINTLFRFPLSLSVPKDADSYLPVTHGRVKHPHIKQVNRGQPHKMLVICGSISINTYGGKTFLQNNALTQTIVPSHCR